MVGKKNDKVFRFADHMVVLVKVRNKSYKCYKNSKSLVKDME